MLSLAILVPIKRRTLKERLRLCPKERIIKDSFNGRYGEINVYRIYHFSSCPFFTADKLSSALKERIYSPQTKVPEEYLKKAILLRLIDKLKKNPCKTVFLGSQFSDTALLGQLCRYSKKVYVLSDTLGEKADEIYKKYGTLPQCTALPVAADYCPDMKEPLLISLPKELQEICPKEFSPLLFAALLYKENGVMII